MIFRFGDHEVDTDAFEVRRRGEPVPVEPQVFDVLAYLVANRERLVTKEELLDQVWGDRFVSESALTSRLKSARRAVGDDGTAQRVIRTMHGRGYRFVAELDDEMPATEERNRLGMPSTWPLLGRTDELTWLADLFHGSTSGGALLRGGAGVGKTRLAQEALHLVEEAGVPVARAAGHPEGRALPLAALAHLLPGNVAEAGPDGDLDLAAVFHRARSALRERDAGQRSLLWVDDVDQLDELSLAVLASLIMARDVFAVLTMRTPGETPAAVRSLVKDRHLDQLDLAPLDGITLETLLHRVLGAPVEASTVQLLVGTAQGNAGVLRQLVFSSLEAGTLAREDGAWTLTGPMATTSDLRQLVKDRLAGLGDQARLGLELLAVVGHLGLDLLIGLVGEEAVEHLDDRGLLDVRTSGRRTDVAAAHPLFGEVLRLELPTMRGRRVRRLAAAALAEAGARRREDPVRITAWQLDAGGSVDPEVLVSAVRLSVAEGDDHLTRRLLDRLDDAADPATATQLRAEWHFRRGDSRRVEQLLARLTAEDVTPATWAQVVRRRATNRFYGMGDFEGAVQLIDQAVLPLTGPPRLALEALRAMLLALGGHVARAAALAGAVLDAAEGPIRLEVLRARSLALAVHGQGDVAVSMVEEGLTLRNDLASDLYLPGVSTLRFSGVVALTEMGRFEEAATASEEAGRRRAGGDGGWSGLAASRLYLARGDTVAVREALRAPLANAQALRNGATERWLLALVAQSRLYEGDLATATVELRRAAELEDGRRGLFHNDIDRAKAWLAVHDHGTDVGCDLLASSAADAAATGKYAIEAALLHDVVRLGRAALVVDRLGELATVVAGPLAPLRRDHAAAVARGDSAALEAVGERFDALGSPLLAAEAWAQAAACHDEQGPATDAARDAWARSEKLASRFGAPLRTPALARPGSA